MPHPTVACVVQQNGRWEPIDPNRDYADDDPLVKAYPWAFVPLENAGKIIDSVGIEDASAEPGRKRRVTVKK